jgi:NAD(P)-dependent dehydrogenase (short-subunit alcohol dehydrogenase family)
MLAGNVSAELLICRLTTESGQTAIITGAAQGIGAETAAILAREGCKVVIADIDAGTAL